MYDFEEDDDVVMICDNCTYDSEEYFCSCKQRAEDIHNGKKLEVDYCHYFQQK